MTAEKMYKWMQHTFSSGGYTGQDYKQFQREMRADLNKQLKDVGLKLHVFYNNHYCFSAVVTDGERFVYVSMGDVRIRNARLFENVLYRTMANDTDWHGGINNYCSWKEIGVQCKRMLAYAGAGVY